MSLSVLLVVIPASNEWFRPTQSLESRNCTPSLRRAFYINGWLQASRQGRPPWLFPIREAIPFVVHSKSVVDPNHGNEVEELGSRLSYTPYNQKKLISRLTIHPYCNNLLGIATTRGTWYSDSAPLVKHWASLATQLPVTDRLPFCGYLPILIIHRAPTGRQRGSRWCS